MRSGYFKFDRAFRRDCWRLVAPYWKSEEKWKAWGLLAVVVALNLSIVYINVLLNQWNVDFYNALQNLDRDGFFKALIRFCWLAGSYILIAVYMLYLNQMLQIKWRTWLTRRYLNDWLSESRYYRMQLVGHASDNPDQRISEDINALVSSTLGLGLGLLRAVVTLVSFVAILWSISGSLDFKFNGSGVSIPGYMVWCALIYSVAGTWLTSLVGRPLVGLNYMQQRFEADFRFGMARIRENSESIAIYGGDAREKESLDRYFGKVIANFWAIMRRQKKLTYLNVGYNQIAIIFPMVVAAPRYFSGVIKLGELMQISSAFGQVHDSLSYIANSYVEIAAWKAVVERLTGFTADMERVDELRRTERIVRDCPELADPGLYNLDAALPDGRILTAGLDLRLRSGQAMIITGPSGVGKSTMLRAVAGIWPFGEGRVCLPGGERVMFLSQKPYLPLGTLREAMSYPGPVCRDDALCLELLDLCGLPQLKDKLDLEEHWSQILSLGEQQRVAFVRLLLNRPEFIFMDEATASLDEPTESRLYAELRRRLPDACVVSVGHRGTLLRHHDVRLELRPGGTWSLSPIPAA